MFLAAVSCMQWKYVAVALLLGAGCLPSDSESLQVGRDGGTAGSGMAGSGQLHDAAPEAAGAPNRAPMRFDEPFDEPLERRRCLARPIRDCAEHELCEVYVLGAAYPDCPGAEIPAFCGLRRTICGLAVWCAVDPRGVVWGSRDTCGRTEALQLGWRLEKACMPGTAEDDAGVPIEAVRPKVCSTPTTPEPQPFL
jgi:hypothetical protein